MTRRRRIAFLLSLIFALAPSAALAQGDAAAKQALNEQLWEATRKGDAVAVKALLDRGADVNAKFRYGSTALFKAAERGHTEVVKLLLERGADATIKDTFYNATAMTWALSNKHVEAVRALLEKDAEGVGDVLMTGTREGNAALVRIALERGGAKPDTLTAALVAASGDKEKAEIAELLKKAGAVSPPEVDDATLQSYVGKYKGEPGPEIIITFKDKTLFAAPPGQPPLALMATDKTTFRPTAFDGLTLTFNVEGGKVTSLAFKRGENTTQLKRVEDGKP